MPAEKSERKVHLIEYVQDSIKRLEAGEISRLPTYKSIANQFGYKSIGSTRNFLLRRGINLSEYKTPFMAPEPSPDLAWFLGILSSGGTVQRSGTIRLANTHENVLEKFRLIGERLFLINVHKIVAGGEKSYGGPQPGYQFQGVEAARFLGDLRRDSWARTILLTHPWATNNPRYIWGFVNGFFEKRGKIEHEISSQSQHNIILVTKSSDAANLLAEMLVRVGVWKPTIQNTGVEGQKIKGAYGIYISNFRDRRTFSQHIHSVVPEKERVLECYRTDQIEISQSGVPYKYTREKFIQEWEFIRKALGRVPTIHDIDAFRKDGKTEISGATYAYRFGQRSFVRAREELERISRGE